MKDHLLPTQRKQPTRLSITIETPEVSCYQVIIGDQCVKEFQTRYWAEAYASHMNRSQDRAPNCLISPLE